LTAYWLFALDDIFGLSPNLEHCEKLELQNRALRFDSSTRLQNVSTTY